jgi:hypothetical protein
MGSCVEYYTILEVERCISDVDVKPFSIFTALCMERHFITK